MDNEQRQLEVTSRGAPEEPLAAPVLEYPGLSVYLPEGKTPGVHLLLGDTPGASMTPEEPIALSVGSTLPLREALTALLRLGGRVDFQPEESKLRERYVEWRRSLDPTRPPVELAADYCDFVEAHSEGAWLGCDPSVSLSSAGLTFETLDASGRLYGCLSLAPELLEGQNQSALDALASAGLSATFEGGDTLLASLSQLAGQERVSLYLSGTPSAELSPRFVEEGRPLRKPISGLAEWRRSWGQLLSAATGEARQFTLSRMDLYNLLRELRLRADQPKAGRALRFALIPGKAPTMSMEPWGWHQEGSGDPYRGARAEQVGVWDRRDLLIFDRLLPFAERVEVQLLGEAQPCFWTIVCGGLRFTLGVMGFRPNNWAKGVLLDVAFPWDESQALDAQLVELLGAGPASLEELKERAGAAEEALRGALKRLLQHGQIRPSFQAGRYELRSFPSAGEVEALRFRSPHEALAGEPVERGLISYERSEDASGALEIVGVAEEPKAAHMPQAPRYAPRFLLADGAQLRKVACDCAWMKDREKQKAHGPCAHIRALWLQVCLDEAARRAAEAADPSLIEEARRLYLRRSRSAERRHELHLKRRRLTERWQRRAEEPERTQRLLFNSVAEARDAYLNRLAELERRGFMDASQG